jgi:SNF2 family DNA or RNA helicase
MTNIPNLIDNVDKKLSSVLSAIFSESKINDGSEARIASAYFSPAGFVKIIDSLKDIKKVHLLLGADMPEASEMRHKRLDETRDAYANRQLKEKLKAQIKFLKEERDHFPFNRATSTSIKLMVDALNKGNIAVRRYERAFMHAKAYILSNSSFGSSQNSVIVGSSNLTSAGLGFNRELNMSRQDGEVIQEAIDWFDLLWDEAEEFDLASIFEELFNPRLPFEIFLRVLWELYGDEVEKDSTNDKNLPLTSFQKHGVERAIRLIDECGGVIVADEVGLGKTFIAGEILTRYMERRQRVLLICPASLRDSTWKKFKSDYQLHLEVLSFEQLANEEQLKDARRPNANQRHIDRLLDEYQLVIIDEAHNYRNPDAPHRAGALRTLLYGRRKDVLMLTATPVNNSLWDLYHLTRFFLKQDSFLANKGIISIRERFEEAMRYDPANLSPDLLYPVIDATTVKRTRQFVKKHYPNDYIRNSAGEMVPIVFPEPYAITVRYDLDESYPDLFDLIEKALDPDSEDQLSFARYKTETYRINIDEEERVRAGAAVGLIRSGLLKRFESSGEAFRKTISRLISQHEKFTKAIDLGYVISSGFLDEFSVNDDDEFEEVLENSENTNPVVDYKKTELLRDLSADLKTLKEIEKRLKNTAPENDPKLKALVKELEFIAKQAKEESVDLVNEIQKRKVLIFSYYSDTVGWIRDFLIQEFERNPKLSAYKNRIASVSGTNSDDDLKRNIAVEQFAPISSGSSRQEDLIDILISTDVLAEGVNLQQCRHIINYDMPWNPMRLVQRHGRIDRIGSTHNKVFMRTIFPVDRLDELLNLEGRILNKLAMAAASVGVVSPLDNVSSSEHVFSETREEIERLLKEDSGIYERGGTISSSQSGEEYRQTLRKAIEVDRDTVINIPWKSGSGISSSKYQGFFFCVKVGERTYLRFIHSSLDWQVINTNQNEQAIISEIGTCLRIIESNRDTPILLPVMAVNNVYDFWEIVKHNVWESWMHETDPANLQPKVRPLNQKVATFIRENLPQDFEKEKIHRALDILESPWPRRDEALLRKWFDEDFSKIDKAKYLIDKINSSGLEPIQTPEPLPPISIEEVELLVWLAVSKVDVETT